MVANRKSKHGLGKSNVDPEKSGRLHITKRRRQIRELIAARESKLRIWDSVQIGNASQLKRMESALASFVADIQLAVGTRAWDLNMYRMRSAITAAQLTKKNGQALTDEQGDTNTVISGFQKTRFCMMTWENLREQPEEAVDPTSLSTKSHLHIANNMDKKRTNTGLSPSPKKAKTLPEGKTGRMSLQLLEGGKGLNRHSGPLSCISPRSPRPGSGHSSPLN